ncbi:DegT/DnrJ/EryC1/StrS family aminotransferase [Kitasatospora sp. NPDC001175]|uniref:DegT/DnrJ/EryC1/StrS family aminotransferase n=1 Tax=Kitasatospora sp. NPDC001175 TaxID=3157103 RepID=UPI003D070501
MIPAFDRPDATRNASPYLYGKESQAVAAVLDSGHYGHTDVTEAFERGVARFLDVPDAIAVSSGTAALHTALVAAGVGPGCEVIVPSMTFCATIQAILACGANPRFVEVDPGTLCVCPEDVLNNLSKTTTAVMPVLFGGRAVDLAPIQDLLAERHITVIEDAAHAFGSCLDSQRVGADPAVITCFSFGPIKNLTCGQGGMIVPRTPDEAQKIRDLRMLGVVESAAERATSTAYQVKTAGFRYQMSSINAAIGNAQLPHFAGTEADRKLLWRTYRDSLNHVDDVTLVDVDVDHSVPHLCVVRVPHRDQVFRHMKSQGIAVGVHYPPNHLQPAFAPWSRQLPMTEEISRQIMSLPFHQHMDGTDAHRVVTALEQALAAVGAGR